MTDDLKLVRPFRYVLDPTIWVATTCCVVVMCCSGCQTLKHFRNDGAALSEARRWEQGGQEALTRGRLDQAQTFLKRASVSSPKDSRIREQLAEVCILKNEYDQAIVELNRAIELSGNDPELRVKLGHAYLKNGQWLPAARQSELALATNRNLPSAWVLRAETRLSQGQMSMALSDFQRSLSLDSVQPEVRLKLARLHKQMNQPKRALSCLEQMLRSFPQGQQPEDALLLEGAVLMDLAHYKPAIACLSIATNRTGASEDAFVQLCRAQVLAGQPSQARLTLAKASEIFSDPSKLNALLDDLKSDEQRRLAMHQR